MLHRLKRHPFAVAAHFRHCLVITYAYQKEILQPLIPSGLSLDLYGDYGFVAVALVRAEQMRPAAFPSAFGMSFYLTGYRIFCKFTRPSGSQHRGLRIIRSDCDSRILAFAGNMLTHYAYQAADISMTDSDGKLDVKIVSGDGKADLDVTANLKEEGELPPGSVFPDIATARRYAGPLPFTFDYERESHSIIAIKGVRKEWNPKPVFVDIRENSFLSQPMFGGAEPILSNAFYIDDIPYLWKPGIVYGLSANEG